MKKIRTKLRARRGMTLTEVLAAVLILALVAAGVAAGVSASVRVYRRSVTLSDAQTLTSTLSIALMDELRYARELTADINGKAVFTSSTFGEAVSVGDDGKGHVTVGNKELIGEGAYAGLTADANATYNAEKGLFKVTLKVCLAGTNGDMIRDVVFFVRPLNV